jgi:hypothetical protein
VDNRAQRSIALAKTPPQILNSGSSFAGVAHLRALSFRRDRRISARMIWESKIDSGSPIAREQTPAVLMTRG